jgi:hypothetical protein
MTNYQNGKIYKIEALNGEEGDVYIGSTCKQYLSQRMQKHRSGYKSWKDGNLKYVTSFSIFDKYGVDNCVIILMENCPCNTIDELHSREAFHIKSMKCVNIIIPLRTQKEYQEDNKENIKKNKERYIQDNRDYLNKWKRQYYKDNKDQKVKQYLEDNKEKISKNAKQNYDENREKILEKMKKKIVCDCEKVINFSHQARHLRSKLHNKLILCKEVKQNRI